MKKLLQGIVDFRENLTDEKRDLFAKLALGQKPDALFIACSDSRVVPNLFASTNPGDLFVLRNIGNLIPPHSNSGENCAQAAIEFSLFTLNISDIIICGHSECGAMQALLEGGVDASCCPHLTSWLKFGEESLKKIKNGFTLDPTLSTHNQLSQVNVLQQMHHITQYPFIRERIEKKRLRVHGWWFDIAHADVYAYEPRFNRFELIDEKHAKLILEKLS